MSLATSPVIGTIRMEPQAAAPESRVDDSTLGLVLASYARRGSLDGEPLEVTLVASTRLSRLQAAGDAATGVWANLAQLLEDLQEEYEQLTPRLQR